MVTKVKNPILTGFNPDPSMIYADGSFYIATSTFEYFPGVQIHKSDDLVNWEVVARPAANGRIDMRSVPQSGGVWAPCLSYNESEKLFYLVYSNLTSWSHGPFKDCANYIITAEDVAGEWSEPIYINSSGFDASLYHDDDGKKYFLNVKWDYRKPNGKEFEGIYLQQWDSKKNALVGERYNIFKGTDRGLVEGPHIYKKDGYYYLFTAEGGTTVFHAETVARSKSLTGPYELHPYKHIVTASETNNPMQKAGHASMCCGKDGNWYMAHLIGRKEVNGRCPLGRETAIQNIEWRDGWPYVAGGIKQGNQPRSFFEINHKADKKPANKYIEADGRVNLSDESLRLYFQSLRVSLGDKIKIIDAHTLELTGDESLRSLAGQSAALVRQQDFKFSSQVTIEANPTGYNHIAGLLYRYNEDNQYLFYITHDEFTEKKILSIMLADNGEYTYYPLDIYFDGDITLKVDVDYASGRFSFITASGVYQTKNGDTEYCKDFVKAWKIFDVSVLSDEYANPMGFTGAFVGMYAADFDSRKWTARFKDFKYKSLDTN